MRRAVTFALLPALAGCGPSQGDIERALRDHFAAQAEIGVDADIADVRDAAIADFEGCEPVAQTYACDVSFQTPDGVAAAKVYMIRSDGAWSVDDISIVEEVG